MPSPDAAFDPPPNTLITAPESETELGDDEEYEEIEVEEEVEEEIEEEVEVDEDEEEEEDEDDEVVEEAEAENGQELASSMVEDIRKDKEKAADGIAEELSLPNENNHKKQETDEEEVKADEETENAVNETQVIKEDNGNEEMDEKGVAEIANGITACKKEDHGQAQGMEEYAAAEIAEERAPTIANDHKEENGQVLEPARLDMLLRSDSATLQEPLADPPPDSSVARDNNDNYRTPSPNETNEKEATVDGNKAHSDDANISLHEGGVVPEKAFGCEINAAIFGVDCASKRIKYAQHSKDMADQEAVQNVEDMDISPRSELPHSRPRSLSPGAECNDKSKRQAIICDFFAKGWCIKGNSCRFLHLRGNAASSPKDGRVDAKLKGILAENEGLKDTTAISAKNVPSDVALSCIEREGTLRSKSGEEVSLDKNDHLCATSLKDKDIGKEYLQHKPYLVNYSHSSSPMLKKCSQTFGDNSFGKGLPSKSYLNAGVPTYFSHFDEIRSKGSQILHDGHPLPTLNHSVERVPLYPSASCWNATPPGLQKPVEGSKERSISGSASLQHRSPPISGSESELISHADVSAFTQRSSLYKPKPSFYNWEPSVPFRPSFLITRRMLSEASLYDPIRDSIEQTNARDKSSLLPFSGQGASVFGTPVCENADPIITGSLDPDQNSNKHSVSSHSSHKDSLWRNPSGKENELKDTAGSPQDNICTSLKGKQHLKSTEFRDNTEADKAHFSNDIVQKNGPKSKMEPKVEKAKGHNNVDGLVHQESRAGKHFQSALVEFIKELLKPTWREGLLTRDAYKVIVKKTADKVLRALPPQQIPDNSDSVKEYLSFAQPKLEKLVLGYVDKYGKC